MGKRVEFVWPDELVGRVDAARGDVPRSKFVQRALERSLKPALVESLGPSPSADALRASAQAAKVAPQVPGVTTAGAIARRQVDPVMLERQARLNKAKGS